MMASDRNLSVCLLIDGDSLQGWEYAVISKIVDDTSCSVDKILINESNSNSSKYEKLQSLVSEFSLWKLNIAIKFASNAISETPWYRTTIPLDDISYLDDISRDYYTPISANGLGNRLPDDAISEMDEVDIGIRFGFGIVVGDALSAPEYGVLSYHHGNLREYRGKPAGFYEFLHDKQTAGVTVQRLNETLDGGEILAYSDVDIQDAKSRGDVVELLFEESPSLMSEAIDTVVNHPSEIETPCDLGDIYTTPSNSDMRAYTYKRALKEFGFL